MSTPTYNPTTQTVRAKCTDCDGAFSVFQFQQQQVQLTKTHTIAARGFNVISYMLFRCPGCGNGALAVLHNNGNLAEPGAVHLESFYPFAGDAVPLPPSTPKDLEAEFREAELCAAAGAYRAASALLRSTLEKTLKANGYTRGNDPTLRDLQKRIDAAANDGIITDVRRKKAHDDIRSLGNDVLHDDWREVMPEEFDTAHHYTQRILEDFYDDRPTVEATLTAKKRISPPAAPTTP